MAIEHRSEKEKVLTAPPIKLGDFRRARINGETGDVLRVLEALRTGEAKLPELSGVPSSITGQEPEAPVVKLTIVPPQTGSETPR